MRTSTITRDEIFPLSSVWTKFKPAVQIIFASLFLGICAQISIPLYFTPVPLTGQTFGILLVGSLLGSRKGALAALLYLIEGCLGMPVWASGAFGLHHFAGPTGGYLMAYPIQAFLAGWIVEKQQKFSTAKTAAALSFICLAQLGIGSLWLSLYVGIKNVLMMGFYPFIPGEIVKAFAVAAYLKTRKKS